MNFSIRRPGHPQGKSSLLRVLVGCMIIAGLSQACRNQEEDGKPEPLVCGAEGECPVDVIRPIEHNQENPAAEEEEPPPPPPPPPPPEPVANIRYSFAPLSSERLAELEAKAETWREFGFTCPSGYAAKPSADQPCDDGDSVIFNGLLCFSGDARACQAVGDSQDADGRWWRSPRRAAGEGRVAKTSFSRDQLLGVVFYLIALNKTDPEQAKERALKWHTWIKANGDAVCTESGTTCRVAPLNWTLIARLFDHLKLPLDSNLKGYLGTESNKIIISVIQLLTKAGFELHNYAATTLAFAEMGHAANVEGWSKAITKVKGMEDNPFMQLSGKIVCAGTCKDKTVLNEPVSLDDIAINVIAKCPDVASTSSNRSQWGWERATAEEAWKNSMGWDCVFLANLLRSTSDRAALP